MKLFQHDILNTVATKQLIIILSKTDIVVNRFSFVCVFWFLSSNLLLRQVNWYTVYSNFPLYLTPQQRLTFYVTTKSEKMPHQNHNRIFTIDEYIFHWREWPVLPDTYRSIHKLNWFLQTDLLKYNVAIIIWITMPYIVWEYWHCAWLLC